jgi:D-hexose-6-phosphate mutarotase
MWLALCLGTLMAYMAICCLLQLWNPWAEKAAALSDFADEEFNRMVCIEPGYVSDYLTVAPGEKVRLQQTIRPRD